MKINLVGIARPRPADAALLRGADSLGDHSHIWTQMQVRIDHHPEQIVSVFILGAASEQGVLEVLVSIAQLPAESQIRVAPFAQGDVLNWIESVRGGRRIFEITVVFIVTEGR